MSNATANGSNVGEIQTKSNAPLGVANICKVLKSETVEAFKTSNRPLLDDVRVRFDAMKTELQTLQNVLDTTLDIARGPIATEDSVKWLNGYTRIRAAKNSVKETVVTPDC